MDKDEQKGRQLNNMVNNYRVLLSIVTLFSLNFVLYLFYISTSKRILLTFDLWILCQSHQNVHNYCAPRFVPNPSNIRISLIIITHSQSLSQLWTMKKKKKNQKYFKKDEKKKKEKNFLIHDKWCALRQVAH